MITFIYTNFQYNLKYFFFNLIFIILRKNCETKEFKDTSINGIPNLKAKWTSSNNDELIDIVINKSCEENNLINE